MLILIVGTIIIGFIYSYIIYKLIENHKKKNIGKHSISNNNNVISYKSNLKSNDKKTDLFNSDNASFIKCDVCGKEIKKEESYKGCCKECASEIINTMHNSKNSALIQCKICHHQISKNANVCPYCGEPINNEDKNKSSIEFAMGICSGLAILINPLSLLSIAGFILSIITLSNKKSAKHGYAIFCLILNIITFLYFWYKLLNLTVTLTLI